MTATARTGCAGSRFTAGWSTACSMRRYAEGSSGKLLREAHVAATGTYCRTALEALVPGCVQAMIPLPIPDDRFAQPIPDARSEGPYRIGFAGRYDDPRKNTGMLLEALALCRAHGLDVTLHLVGGEATPELRAQAAALGIGDKVDFAGKIPDPALIDFYRSLDLFVMASHQEGFAIVAAEAMATGCPVVSTRCGGPEEYVIDGETGRLVGFDASEMAAAVVELLSDARGQRSASPQRARAGPTALLGGCLPGGFLVGISRSHLSMERRRHEQGRYSIFSASSRGQATPSKSITRSRDAN